MHVRKRRADSSAFAAVSVKRYAAKRICRCRRRTSFYAAESAHARAEWSTLPAAHGDMTRLRARRAGALVPRYPRLLREITITRSSYGGARGVTYAEDHVARTIGICRVPAGSEIVVAGECGRRRDTMEVEGTR